MTRECANSRSNRSAATAPAHAHHLPIRMRPGELAGSRGLPGGLFLSPPRELAQRRDEQNPSTAGPTPCRSMQRTSRSCTIGPCRRIPCSSAHNFACCCLYTSARGARRRLSARRPLTKASRELLSLYLLVALGEGWSKGTPSELLSAQQLPKSTAGLRVVFCATSGPSTRATFGSLLAARQAQGAHQLTGGRSRVGRHDSHGWVQWRRC